MTRSRAIKLATEAMREQHREQFVVYECNDFDHCNRYELDTFYQGARVTDVIESDMEQWHL